MTRSATAPLSLGCVALGAAALFVGGCKELKGAGATGGCAVLGDCGGDPTGVWQVNPNPALSCSFPVFSRPAQDYDTTKGYFAPETGAAPNAVTSGAWCWDLSFSKTKNMDGTFTVAVSTPSLPMANPDIIRGGTVTFTSNGTDHTSGSYLYELTATSTTSFHVAHSCFGVNGADVTCAELGADLQATLPNSQPMYAAPALLPDGGTAPAFACHDAGDGCDCSFDYIETDVNAVGDKGTWIRDGNVIHHYSSGGQGNLNEINPSRRTVRDATFCVTDGAQTLQLTGTNGQPIALKSGARSLTLTRVLPDAGADTSNGAGGAGGGADAADTGGTGGVNGGADADADAASPGAGDAADGASN